MNIFLKNRMIIWILTGLLIAALTALVTLVCQHRLVTGRSPIEKTCEKDCDFLSDELELTVEQKGKIGEIRVNCRNNGRVISDSLRFMRTCLLAELSKALPDTLQLRSIAGKIGLLQVQLTNRTIDQYLKISKECTPKQREKLSLLYYEMMGCCKHGDDKEMKNNCMKEE